MLAFRLQTRLAQAKATTCLCGGDRACMGKKVQCDRDAVKLQMSCATATCVRHAT